MVRTQEAASGVDEHPGRVHDEVADEVRRDVRVPDERPVRYVFRGRARGRDDHLVEQAEPYAGNRAVQAFDSAP